MAYTSIFFGEIDSAAIEAEILSQYALLSGRRTPNPSDPEYITCLTIAYARALNLQSIDRAGKANLIDFATGQNLDYLAKILGLERIADGPSVTRLGITLTTGHAQVVIPAGFLVTSQDGTVQYEVNEDTTVPVGTDYVVVDATCTVDGSFSNGYAIGTVNVIQNPLPFVTTATNIDVTTGGADIETDESFRSRWYAGLSRLSGAGPKGAYKFWALTASLTIIDVNVLGPEDGGVMPGDVELRILETTGVPTQAVLNAVFAVLDDETVRPICDTPKVYAANQILYSLNVSVTAFLGADISSLPAAVAAAIKVYTDTQGNKIGYDVVDDAIIVAGKIDGVKDLNLNGFTGIAVDKRSFARCTAINVTVTNVEEP